MLKENLHHFIFSLFVGFLVIYYMNEPKTVVIKHPNINKISNITYFEEEEDMECSK